MLPKEATTFQRCTPGMFFIWYLQNELFTENLLDFYIFTNIFLVGSSNFDCGARNLPQHFIYRGIDFSRKGDLCLSTFL